MEPFFVFGATHGTLSFQYGRIERESVSLSLVSFLNHHLLFDDLPLEATPYPHGFTSYSLNIRLPEGIVLRECIGGDYCIYYLLSPSTQCILSIGQREDLVSWYLEGLMEEMQVLLRGAMIPAS